MMFASDRERRVGLSALCFCLAICTASQAAVPSWREFLSSPGFRISYPAAWFRIYASPKVLDITSSSRRLEGVVISKGAQMITVRETSPIYGDDYARELASADSTEQILSSSVRRIGNYSNGCADVHIIESEDEIGPHTFYLEHHMYCKIRDRLFVLSLTQWKDDPPSANAYEVASHMLETLRLQQ